MPRRLTLRDLLAGEEVCHYATVTDLPASIEAHDHDFLEIYWVTDGTGTERLGGADVQLSAGSVAFVRHDDAHRFVDRGHLRFRNLAFGRPAWRTLTRRYPRLADRLGQRGVIGVDGLRQVEAAATDLRAGRRDALARDRVLLALDAALAETQAALPDWLAVALTADLVGGGVPALVRSAGRSAAHVSRACRAHLGRTPTDVVNEARLTHAARLLERTGRDVTDIWLTSGFGNAGHFHKLFRERFGVTPLRYRQRQRAVR